jgi:hypothetical protein
VDHLHDVLLTKIIFHPTKDLPGRIDARHIYEQRQLGPVGIRPQRFQAAHGVFAPGGGRVRHINSFTAIISIIAMVVIKIAKASGGGDFPPFV